MTNPEAGGRLGRYELLKKLGEGGMGAVWLARLTGAGGFQKLCLVKTVLPSIATDAQFLSRFHHEGRVLTQLQHSNIAQIYDMSEDGGTLFLAMEYVSGVDLARLVEQMQGLGQAIPVPLALFIAHELVEGLAFAHRKASHDGSPLRIVHRDVSPQNVMVSYEGEVKVIDFGIAKSEARSRHTTEATVMGKLGYLAPEQARGEAVDHRADQYACAIVLWELLANTPYLTRGTLTEMLVAMANPPPLKPLRPLRPEVPPLLEQEVLKALNPDRNQRFPTTDDFSRALMGVMLQMGTVPTHQQLGEFVRSRCLSDYQSQRLLMTNVETMRGPIPLTGGQRGASPEASDDALGRTHVRTGESSASSHSAEPAAVAPPGPASAPPPPAALAPAPAAAPPSLAPPPKPASAPRPFPNPLDDAPEMRDSAYTPGSTSSGSKAPLFIVLGLVLLLGAGGLAAGAWWLLFRDKGESTASALPSPAVIAVTPTPAATTPPPVAPGIPAATVGQPTPAPAPAAPEQPEQPEQRPGSAVPTASADPAPVAPPPGEAVPEGTRPPNAPPAPSGPLESADFVVGVRESEGALYVRAGRDVGLVAGQTLSVLGAEVEPGKRPRIGTATIAEVLEFKSRVTLDGAATAAAGERVVAIPQGGSAPADLGATPTPPPTVTGEPPPRPAPPPTTASPLPPTTIGGPASQRGSAAAPPRPQATPPSVRPSAPPPPPRRSGVVPPPPPPPRRAVTPAPPPPPRR